MTDEPKPIVMKNYITIVLLAFTTLTFSQNYITGLVNIPTEHTEDYQLDSLKVTIYGSEGEPNTEIVAIPEPSNDLITNYLLKEDGIFHNETLTFDYENNQLKTIINQGNDYSSTSVLFYSNGLIDYELFYEDSVVTDSLDYIFEQGLLTKQVLYYGEDTVVTELDYNDGKMMSFSTSDGLEATFTYDENGQLLSQVLEVYADSIETLGQVDYYWSPKIVTAAHTLANTVNNKFYPNPVSESLIVETEELVLVKLYDTSGKVIYNHSVNGQTIIQRENYSPGLYFIQFGTNEMQKVIFK